MHSQHWITLICSFLPLMSYWWCSHLLVLLVTLCLTHIVLVVLFLLIGLPAFYLCSFFSHWQPPQWWSTQHSCHTSVSFWHKFNHSLPSTCVYFPALWSLRWKLTKVQFQLHLSIALKAKVPVNWIISHTTCQYACKNLCRFWPCVKLTIMGVAIS